MSTDPTSSDPTRTDPTRTEKARLRRRIRAERNALPRAAARAAAFAAVHRLWSLPCMAGAHNIALYLPAGGEIDCTPLAVQAWSRGRRVFLPIVAGRSLRFAPFNPRSELRTNRFGIPEPVTSRRAWRSARQLDVIVAPLVAFDERGHRLGMGGGFYDRALAFLLQRSQRRRPHFVALAFEMQKLEDLHSDAWDVGLDAVITESETYRFT